MKRAYAKIAAIQTFLPTGRLTNAELATEFPEWRMDKIYEKTGIEQRAVSQPGQCASDLGIEAARKLFASGICSPNDIDYLLFCTQSPDYFLPTTACLIQDSLKLPTHCGALDFNLGCSGFIYGLSLAKGLIETETAGRVLLITADTYTKFIHPNDKSVRTLFGDGAAATLITAELGLTPSIGPFVFGTDGRGAKNLIVPVGGSRSPEQVSDGDAVVDDAGNTHHPNHLFMNGPAILTFTLNAVPKAVHALLEKASLTKEQVDYFIFHQASRVVLNSLQKKLSIPDEKFCVNLKDCGNTVSATIPMAMEIALQNQQIRPGNKVALVGFGVGYSWGGCLITV
jgi:3-oxoacyl-[acyl-carrier-protein] synthase-3